MKPATKPRLSAPAGMARIAVRGLSRSRSASAKRLKAMAAVRAETMQTTIRARTRGGGPATGGEHGAGQGKGKSKDAVLPLDHLKGRNGITGERTHTSILICPHHARRRGCRAGRAARLAYFSAFASGDATCRLLVTLKTPGTVWRGCRRHPCRSACRRRRRA